MSAAHVVGFSRLGLIQRLSPAQGESLPIRLGNETAKFIEAYKDKPFLAFLSFYSVHGPIQTHTRTVEKIPRQGRVGWIGQGAFQV